MSKLFTVLIGLILLIVPVYSWIINLWGFGDAALALVKGGVVWVLIFVGLATLFSGISGLKD